MGRVHKVRSKPKLVRRVVPITQPKIIVKEPMSIASLADRLGIFRQRIYHLIRDGELKYINTSMGPVIPPEECERLLNSAFKVQGTTGKYRIVFERV